MNGILRAFCELAVAFSKQDGDFVAARASQDDVRICIAIEEACRQRPWFLAHVQLHLIVKASIAVSDENGQRIAAHVGGHEIRYAILVDVNGRDGGGILADLVARKVIKEIRRNVWVLLGAGDGPQYGEKSGHHKRPALSSRHWLPWPHHLASLRPDHVGSPALEKGFSIRRRLSRGNESAFSNAWKEPLKVGVGLG